MQSYEDSQRDKEIDGVTANLMIAGQIPSFDTARTIVVAALRGQSITLNIASALNRHGRRKAAKLARTLVRPMQSRR